MPKLNQTASKKLRGLLFKPVVYCFLISEIQSLHFGNFNSTTDYWFIYMYMIGVISQDQLSRNQLSQDQLSRDQ